MMELAPKIKGEWAELLVIVIVLFGFLISIATSNDLLNYLIILMFGVIGGKMIFERHGKAYFAPTVLVVFSILVGYTIGAMIRSFNSILIILLFLIGIYVGYEIHKRGWLNV